MNVLFLSYNGLLEAILPSQAVPYLEGLAKKGHTFVLLTYEKRSDIERLGRAAIRKRREELKGKNIEWRWLAYHKTPPLFSTFFDLTMGIVYTGYLIVRRRISLVHVRGITPGTIMLFWKKFLKVMILFDMRGLLAEEYAGGGLWKEGGIAFRCVKSAERHMLRACSAVTVLTRKHFDMIKELDYLIRRRVPMAVVPCCVDLGRFSIDPEKRNEARRRLGLDDKFVLMYPGKIGTFYLMDPMLAFYKGMLDVIPGSVFLIVTNDATDHVAERARAMGIPDDRIRFLKGVHFEEMPQYVRIADAGIFFINPYKKFGSSPIKMGEFLASGVPVVINPGIGDTEELVRDNRVGVVAAGLTVAAYTHAVDDLRDLRKDIEGLKVRCRVTAARYLSLEHGIAEYDAIYNKLAAKGIA